MLALFMRRPVGRMNRSYLGGLRVKPGGTNVTCTGGRQLRSSSATGVPALPTKQCFYLVLTGQPSLLCVTMPGQAPPWPQGPPL